MSVDHAKKVQKQLQVNATSTMVASSSFSFSFSYIYKRRAKRAFSFQVFFGSLQAAASHGIGSYTNEALKRFYNNSRVSFTNSAKYGTQKYLYKDKE
ncbi:hypothetical protein V6N12_051286 [Hibiscus sabdariffa]|uniref:Uncharacterized protein n=1 Tax=Hibiscus sabdariffa TaxID=183260 RepID=A0ABR2GEV4_9ROSI